MPGGARRLTASLRYEEIGVGADARIEASCPRLHAKLRTIIEKLPIDQGLVLGTCDESPKAKRRAGGSAAVLRHRCSALPERRGYCWPSR